MSERSRKVKATKRLLLTWAAMQDLLNPILGPLVLGYKGWLAGDQMDFE